ncbi:hydroxymethylglutaryl-CoA synthase [Parendozoicomonas haliclonae]|uniref:Polyketide biosynthesis 3-hydroxy-3-methylglutaryl-ACP synthase PksG n=1 Tax=Parendozoicomonas haliclonae TaxID=1960125 RepID=A0A1X7AHE5_9GAMM|nr:hydroxymethylglutaryl-CoA synthase [Parendozoicomonas haliclonae]SMA42611.1 Polyketide biosynthesis 3-hydroxy-3-methylglutaryl-ACP synthase PksG [Parendozoicomonas haliclonae]
MSIGIDDISFYSSGMYLPLATLAEHNGEDPDKYRIGLGQDRMGVPSQDEDIVTLAANAGRPLVTDDNRNSISTILFATESSIDQSKAAGVYVHRLLQLGSNCRVVELKQACYSATAALQMACGIVARKPDAQVMVIASDIARYGFGTPGEATQGCGAVAFIVKSNPRLLSIHAESGCYSEDVMDFWRPNYRDTALVDGKYSTIIYLKALRQSWKNYEEAGGLAFDQFSRFCYHLPFGKMAEKAHRKLAVTNGVSMTDELLEQQIGASLHYSRQIGNSYSAALYIGIASLLENDAEDLSGKHIGLFSYGSGCVGEFFSATVQPGYREHARRQAHVDMLEQRQELDYPSYVVHFGRSVPADGGRHDFAEEAAGYYRLAGVHDHKRIYTEIGD